MRQMHEIAHDLTSNFLSGVSNQLKARGIISIHLENLEEPLRGALEYRQAVTVATSVRMIALNMSDTLSDWAHTVGHELGHTFQEEHGFSRELLSSYCHRHGIKIATLEQMRSYLKGGNGCTEEEFHFYWKVSQVADEVFCEIFSSIWLAWPGVRSELEGILSALSRENSIVIL